MVNKVSSMFLKVVMNAKTGMRLNTKCDLYLYLYILKLEYPLILFRSAMHLCRSYQKLFTSQ